MAGLLDLAKWCDALPGRISVAGNARKVDTVLSIETGLVQSTPIDTGAAISNWQVTVGLPATEPIEPYFPSKKGVHDHATLGDGLSGRVFNANAAIETARAVTNAVKAGEDVFISNPLPYIGRLNEDGTSPQASPGFVERAIDLAASAGERAKLVP